MSQQKPHRSNDDVYKKKLFYDNGLRFVEVKGRMTGEYIPPQPVLKSHANETLQSSSGLVQRGTAHYQCTVTFLFSSKHEFADWLQHIGSQHKFYDEKGTIYYGIVNGEVEIRAVEQETKYIVAANLLLIRKQDFEQRQQYHFIDIEDHWARAYIDEMQQRGLLTVYDHSGEPIQYFKPETYLTRADAVTFVTRVFKYLDKRLRGY